MRCLFREFSDQRPQSSLLMGPRPQYVLTIVVPIAVNMCCCCIGFPTPFSQHRTEAYFENICSANTTGPRANGWNKCPTTVEASSSLVAASHPGMECTHEPVYNSVLIILTKLHPSGGVESFSITDSPANVSITRWKRASNHFDA